ncbi:MAG: hypothetical protein AABZ39_13400 [Spirochaetota bacterium]
MTSMQEPVDRTKWARGRYGIVCPNNNEYRAYVKANLTELNERYRFEGMFLDMPFWPEVCYCASCRERYFKEAGKDMPTIVDWGDAAWLSFQRCREAWLGEFAAFSTQCVKAVSPAVTIEHNFSIAFAPWIFATTDMTAEASDYAGGDLYGGYLEQTFACKYYRNVSRDLPFAFITSRCDPNLKYHTSTKTDEELILHTMTALVHDGAFSVCDGMNPDGTINPEFYTGTMKRVFDTTREFEKYVGGERESNVSVWFSSCSKFDTADNGKRVDLNCGRSYIDGPMKMAGILRENTIPFDVIASKDLAAVTDDVLVISDVASICDEEMDAIERYVMGGGNLYVSGHIGHARLAELMEIEQIGMTEHDFTYMSPTGNGISSFDGFSSTDPLGVDGKQHIVSVKGDCDIVATITLPYTMTGTRQFASIHSNPPGIRTDHPAMILKHIGKGKILWTAAAIETAKPYMSRLVVCRLIRSLCGEMKFSSNAPAHVEIVGWRKSGRRYFAVLNQQETMPVAPVYDVRISIPGKTVSAQILGTKSECAVTRDGTCSVIELPKLELFHVIEVSHGA